MSEASSDVADTGGLVVLGAAPVLGSRHVADVHVGVRPDRPAGRTAPVPLRVKVRRRYGRWWWSLERPGWVEISWPIPYLTAAAAANAAHQWLRFRLECLEPFLVSYRRVKAALQAVHEAKQSDYVLAGPAKGAGS